ncbi:UNVERIFIED_CONTAM: hypothetical protein NCL1_14164 [Trichonephila clavipes]
MIILEDNTISKRKRKRLQRKIGEFLTNENVLERLAAEESDHKNKFHQNYPPPPPWEPSLKKA